MKKINLFSVMIVSTAILSIISCKKDDTTAPVITLTGSNQVNHILNTTYTDQGATATDDTDGDITGSITMTGSVNKDLTGNYTLTYSVTDAAGNSSSVTRTVNVYNQADHLAGAYNSTLTMPWPGGAVTTPTRTITASSTVNKNIVITGFGESTSSSINLVVDLTADTIAVPQQTGSGGYSFGPYYDSGETCTIGTGTPIVIELYSKQQLSTATNGFEEILTKQ